MDHGNVEASLERARHMQAFREEYKIQDTLSDGKHWLAELLQLHQGSFLSFSYNHQDGNYCLIYDLAAVDLGVFKRHPRGYEITFSGGYYFCHGLSPDFDSMRRGVIFMAECKDYDWKKNLDITAVRRFWSELMAVYPFRYQKVKYFNSGMFLNLINSLKKKFLPQNITDKMEYGCKFDGRLSDVYLVPSVEAATTRIRLRMEDSLQRRYHHEATFRLPPHE